MFHRFPTWWRALSVVLLSLATVTWPSAAQAGTTTSFKVVHQDAWVTLSSRGTARLRVSLELPSPHSKAEVRVSLYPRILTRSQLTPIIDGTGSPSSAVASTAPVALGCAARRTVTLTIGLFTQRPGRQQSPCRTRGPRMRLPCSGARCDGVYPLRFTVTIDHTSTIEWSLFAIQATAVAQPIHLNWIETFEPITIQHLSRTIAVLDTIARNRSLPITLSADYRTLSRVMPYTKAALNQRWDGALNEALASPLHRAIVAPPGNIDFSGLVNNDLRTQVAQQLTLPAALLRTITGRYVDSQVLLSGRPSQSGLAALAAAGVRDVILPESALSVAPSSTLNWGAPFHVAGVHLLSALSIDEPLSQLATDESIEPGRRAAMTLATLSFLHFEAPDARSSRSVVMVTSAAYTPAGFIADLASGLGHDPFVRAASLSPSFNTSLIATNGAPATRTMARTGAATWTGVNVSSLITLIGAVNSYNQSMTSNSVSSVLSADVAESEVVGSPVGRQRAISRALNALNGQLNQFSVNAGAITLTGPGTALPITVISRANYPVKVVVHLITSALSFPKGDNITTTLASPTTALRVPTSNHRGSSLTLQVVVTTPNGQVVLARSAIQVRIAGTSVVGYILTIGSLLVLAYWWIRTNRRRPKGRHVR
ncbi:MAG: hypothetical protein ABSG24_04345 [Acidimicrobiales bacterium]